MSLVQSINTIDWLAKDRRQHKIMPSLGKESEIVTMCLLLTSATLLCTEITVKKQVHQKIKEYR